MSSSYPMINTKFQVFDANGKPLSGGFVYTYEAGTTTPKSTTNSSGSYNTNPVILDINGQADIYLSGLYKINVTDLNGVQVSGWPKDNIEGLGYYTNLASGAYLSSFSSLQSAISTIGSSPTTLIIDASAVIPANTNVYSPPNISYQFTPAGFIDGVSNSVLQINGDITKGSEQNFGPNITISGSYNFTNIIQVNTISYLSSNCPYIDGFIVYVAGYYASNDGGQGTFVWDSAASEADNGITIFAVSGVLAGRWKRQFVGAIHTRWGGAYGDNIHDDYQAIQNCIDLASHQGCVCIDPGTYRHTLGFKVPYDRFRLFGDNPDASILNFMPSSSGLVQLAIGNVGNMRNGCSIEGFKLWSDDSSYTKTALNLLDLDIFTAKRIVICGSTVVDASMYYSGGSGSIGILTMGRDMHDFDDIAIYADRPLVIDKNANTVSSTGIDIDHYHFHDFYPIANQHPCIEILTGVNLTQVTFDGYQPWVRGTYGLYWNDTTSTQASNGLKICNVRKEQNQNLTGYSIYIAHNSKLQNLSISNALLDLCNGIYLRKIDNVSVRDSYYTSTNKEAFNADATVGSIQFDKCFWQAGSTATLTDHNVISADPFDIGPLPGRALYNNSTGTSKTSIMDSMLQSTPQTMSTDTILPIGRLGTTGFIFVAISLGVNAIYAFQSATPSMVEVFDNQSWFTPTKDSAGMINLYWSATNNQFEIQNKRAETFTVNWFRIGTY